MANRFTDTEIWKKKWFRTLKPKIKCLVRYLFDNCDHTGIYEVDLELASFLINEEITEEDFESISFLYEKQEDLKVFVPKFILFQCKIKTYEELNYSNNAHKKPIKKLIELGKLPSDFLAPREGLATASLGDKEREREKERERDKDKLGEEVKEREKKKEKERANYSAKVDYSEDFLKFWDSSTKTGSRKKAFEVFENVIKEIPLDVLTTAYEYQQEKRHFHNLTGDFAAPKVENWLLSNRWEDEVLDKDFL